jgi:hypothetical protein
MKNFLKHEDDQHIVILLVILISAASFAVFVSH